MFRSLLAMAVEFLMISSDFGTEPEPEPFGRKKRGITLTQQCQDSQCQQNNPGGSITIGIQFLDDDSHEDSDEDSDEDFDEDD